MLSIYNFILYYDISMDLVIIDIKIGKRLMCFVMSATPTLFEFESTIRQQQRPSKRGKFGERKTTLLISPPISQENLSSTIK